MIVYQDIKTKPFFLLGPCVIEDMELLHIVAKVLVQIRDKYNVPIYFKASFDKANRTSLNGFRGPGLEKGLQMLGDIKSTYRLPIVTDIHESHQAGPVGEVVDMIQIPAFLCRQTDLLVAAAKTGRIVNIKKAQFMSGKDMFYPSQKVKESGNEKIILTERGNVYGYNNLAVDFRNLVDMQELGYPVCMDCTHSVQRPSALDGKTGGDRRFVPMMAMAAKAFGANGYFLETHPNPELGKSDAANMLYLNQLEQLIEKILAN
jgi:2-dehydro-3-deoxyphosphooctonate aldolase (KDO 8-P synthase)